MTINTLLTASLLACLTPSASTGSLPKLCDDVYLDEEGVPLHDSTGLALARYCEQTGPRAPRWDGAVCCSFDAAGAHCVAPSSTGGCAVADEKSMWCDYGAQGADGSVKCSQPLPSTCDFADCVAPPPDAPLEAGAVLCCFTWGCFEPAFEESCGGGYLTYCSAPYTNEDGNVGCADHD